MGFLDFLSDMADIAKDIAMLPVEVGKATGELVQDIAETVAQDVSHKVSGTPDAPIRTSFDIRNEADKVISSANGSFHAAKGKLMSAWDLTSQKAKQVAEKRSEVYQLLGRASSTALDKLPEQPFELIYPSNAPYVDSSFDVGTWFGVLGIGTRMEAAEEYLQRAKEYRAKVESLTNEVNSLRRDVLNIADAQKEELAILETIQAAYQVKDRAVLQESAKLLHEISLLCVQEMNANTDAKYNDLLQHLKRLWYSA